MPANTPRDHHYVPQFYLRNFASDSEKRKITTVAKCGSRAIWAVRSIERLGFERDLYVHMRQGVPISVETEINSRIETPISKSDTWAKIASGRTDALDRSDKPILYALIRHLEVRTPHYLATTMELAQLAASQTSGVEFSDEEREAYSILRGDPNQARTLFSHMSASLEWTEESFASAALSICRTPIPLRSSSVPVISVRAPDHPALRLPLPGMVPYQLVLPLNRTTFASLVLGDFDNAFINTEVEDGIAVGFNRYYLAHFSYFEQVRHLITDRNDLATDMTWAPYDLVDETERKITFKRRVQGG